MKIAHVYAAGSACLVAAASTEGLVPALMTAGGLLLLYAFALAITYDN